MAVALICLSAQPVPAQETQPAGRCSKLLAETLKEMEGRPVLKEELATGLMWMRMEAQEAHSLGDEPRCIGLLSEARKLLGPAETR